MSALPNPVMQAYVCKHSPNAVSATQTIHTCILDPVKSLFDPSFVV